MSDAKQADGSGAAPASGRPGVLLVNLGTPDAPEPAAIRRYLREFLSDRRVVELPRAIWLPLLYGVILPFRPGRLAHAYGTIWTPEGSPLLAYTRALARALRTALGVPVETGMTYGNPSLAQGLSALRAQGADRILLLPLYPQYSATTTAAACDRVFALLGEQRAQPALRTVTEYHARPAYIAALAESLRAHWAQRGRAAHLLISFHGIPERCVQRGDPYAAQCRATAQLLAQALDLPAQDWTLTFQSRLGRAPWTGPYTDAVLQALAAAGVRSADVICPGFPVDCLETLEEISLRYSEVYAAAGGELRYVPALNDGAGHVAMLADLARENLQGW